jgi:hypothetical protein
MKGVILTVVIMLMILAASLYAQEVVEIREEQAKLLKRYTAFSTHSGWICNKCHLQIMGEQRFREVTGGCLCHRSPYGKPAKVTIENVQKYAHDANHCMLCHAGTKNVNTDVYHKIVHYNVSCSKCHDIRKKNDEFDIIKPKSTYCRGCHSEDVHVVHGLRLDRLCEYCHGKEFARKYVSVGLEPPEVKLEKNQTLVKPKEEERGGIPSISELIFKILDIIF